MINSENTRCSTCGFLIKGKCLLKLRNEECAYVPRRITDSFLGYDTFKKILRNKNEPLYVWSAKEEIEERSCEHCSRLNDSNGFCSYYNCLAENVHNKKDCWDVKKTCETCKYFVGFSISMYFQYQCI